ncbi:MAG: tyrosine-type recombinase/integrase [Saprospiraceae bacterium]|nr:tyrosine-type recombinase/integrase [Saprospiraceae bacterium]
MTFASTEWDLYDEHGNRKYLTPEEREAFFKAIPNALDREKRTFALMLYYSGCRISEALAVTHGRIDYGKKGVVFKTLKRRKSVFRFVPLPGHFLTKLDDVHQVEDVQKRTSGKKIWSISRTTAWRAISQVMDGAGIEGVQATPKGLRHSFVIYHQQENTPDHMIQKWLGWASRDMMEVYGRAVGKEERNFAARLWE